VLINTLIWRLWLCVCLCFFFRWQRGDAQLDTRELDHEVKEIMLQIIPVVKAQISSVATEQLLHYVQQLTTSLTRLQQLQSLPHGTASPRYAEFSRFFHRQLDSIVHDSLAKFEGRKYVFSAICLNFKSKTVQTLPLIYWISQSHKLISLWKKHIKCTVLCKYCQT